MTDATGAAAQLGGPAHATWQRLLNGNAAFQRGETPNLEPAARADLVAGQAPRAVVLGCADSRVPVEEIFGVGPGELFTVRTAGLALGPEVLGSLEYAVSVLRVPLLIVLGHTTCGAVRLATGPRPSEPPAHSHLPRVVQAVTSAWAATCPPWWLPPVLGPTPQAQPFHAHVHGTVWGILADSPLLAQQVQRGHLAVVGAEYDLASGAVRALPGLQRAL